jgi:hypothetical protein
VKEKRASWGAEYEEKRNGEWEYRVFRADKTANPDTKYEACFGCHQSQASQEYMFTLDRRCRRVARQPAGQRAIQRRRPMEAATTETRPTRRLSPEP